jgi:hypothetical protein
MSNEIKVFLTIETDEDYMELYPLYKNRLIERLADIVEDELKYKIKDLEVK